MVFSDMKYVDQKYNRYLTWTEWLCGCQFSTVLRISGPCLIPTSLTLLIGNYFTYLLHWCQSPWIGKLKLISGGKFFLTPECKKLNTNYLLLFHFNFLPTATMEYLTSCMIPLWEEQPISGASSQMPVINILVTSLGSFCQLWMQASGL